MSKTFHIADILMVSTGRALDYEGNTEPSMTRLGRLMSHLTGYNLMTHQLIEAFDPCSAGLHDQFPWLATVEQDVQLVLDNARNGDDFDAAAIRHGMREIGVRYGETHEVVPLPEGTYDGSDPIGSLQKMLRPDQTLIVVERPPDDEQDE